MSKKTSFAPIDSLLAENSGEFYTQTTTRMTPAGKAQEMLIRHMKASIEFRKQMDRYYKENPSDETSDDEAYNSAFYEWEDSMNGFSAINEEEG